MKGGCDQRPRTKDGGVRDGVRRSKALHPPIQYPLSHSSRVQQPWPVAGANCSTLLLPGLLFLLLLSLCTSFPLRFRFFALALDHGPCVLSPTSGCYPEAPCRYLCLAPEAHALIAWPISLHHHIPSTGRPATALQCPNQNGSCQIPAKEISHAGLACQSYALCGVPIIARCAAAA